jgi:2-polyprenyl-3-methyl-5-hydroxy-6-metoxy-1,4-benzoquinol methylase
MNRSLRDTDADWRKLGEANPYWAVLNEDRFSQERLSDEAVKDFYRSGEEDVERLIGLVRRCLGEVPHVQYALDFGCGAGRLSAAMAKRAEHVVGYDISSGMLKAAQPRAGENLTFVNALPEGPFDWINALIVFQHIPPECGLPILRDLLSRLAPQGFVTLDFPLYSEEATYGQVNLTRRLRSKLRSLVFQREPDPPVSFVSMYNYSFVEIARAFSSVGIDDMALFRTQHGVHSGFIIVARRG